MTKMNLNDKMMTVAQLCKEISEELKNQFESENYSAGQILAIASDLEIIENQEFDNLIDEIKKEAFNQINLIFEDACHYAANYSDNSDNILDMVKDCANSVHNFSKYDVQNHRIVLAAQSNQ